MPWTSMLVTAVAACAGRPAELDVPGPATRPPPPPATLETVLVLESWGVPAEDTTVTFNAMEPRVILVRRGAPDNSVFAELRLAPGAITPADGRLETRITLLPRPGVFGLDLVLEPGATVTGRIDLTFSYAVHFVMPEAARERHGTAIAFERELFVVRLTGQAVEFLPSRRPASDLLAATITAPGTYLVAAPPR